MQKKGGTMANLLVDRRDQNFVLNEMLNIGALFQTSHYGHLSDEVVNASLTAALQLAEQVSYPTMAAADREGCRLENGDVKVPHCYHHLKKHYDEGGFASTYITRENGGHGFPMSLWSALCEDFAHNLAFLWTWSSPFSATQVISLAGTPAQKETYLPNLVSGKWGSALAANDEGSGSDFTLQTATAVEQADGSYRIKGNKNHVTSGDSDMFENMIHVVVSRVEGDPADGLSTFIVPKYCVNADGSMGPRNDYTIIGLERKLGLNGSPTCSVDYGEHGNCYAELIGQRGQAIPALFQLLKFGYGANGTIATGIASAAYLHALEYAHNRIQGAHIAEAQNPGAKPIAIIAHPDVRRMLLWMKSHVEGMRALTYYSWHCMDKALSLPDESERDKWSGLMDLLLPVCRLYSADRGFKVTETAIQVQGRNGYFGDSPVQQFLRDIKPTSIWEACTGVHALLYVAQTMGQRDGRDFINLIMEMNQAIALYQNQEGLHDLALDLQIRVTQLADMATFFSDCANQGKMLVPVSNAMPFVGLLGDVCVGWMLFQQAGIAAQKLNALYAEARTDTGDTAAQNAYLDQNKQAAFYAGKVHSARFFIKNILPQSDGVASAIKNEDLTLMTIHDRSF
jgi:alkylation response protein AidB-like acyl-CoA dehydrogenase